MKKSTNQYAAVYKAELEKGDIQVAYKRLVKYVMALKAQLAKGEMRRYHFGNVSPGYMDYTHFPFFDDFLRDKKLRFGIVLNHRKLRFELWLMGQNAKVQQEYWELLKNTVWNRERTDMPKYSVLEAVVEDTPDFDDLNMLSGKIEKNALYLTNAVLQNIPK